MVDNEKTKEAIQESLERNFINNKGIVEKEMNLLNVLISSFEGSEYTYDEYCRKRMEYEVKACDEALDVDVEAEMAISSSERIIIQNRAVKKVMGNPDIDYEDAMKEEYIKWQVQKCYDIDKKMFYQISNYSNINLLENKIPKETWKIKKSYFEDICEGKAQIYGQATAEANRNRHEQDIRSSMI